MALLNLPEPLSQVVFVHDYLQLVFGESRLSIYGSVHITVRGVTTMFRQPGFCDAVVSLLGEAVLNVGSDDAGSLHIEFDSGAGMAISPSDHGPESWQFKAGSEIIVG